MNITNYMRSDANPSTSSYFKNFSANAFPSNKFIKVDYDSGTNGSWIYCNQPETLPSDAFGDNTYGNKRLNRVEVNSGTHELFYSYIYNTTNGAQTPFTFGVQIYNRSNSAITFRILKNGVSINKSPVTWNDVPKNSTEDYLTSAAQTAVTIPAGGVHWAIQESVPNYSSLISGLMRFQVNGAATVSVYVYKNSITGDETVYPNVSSDAYYSGYCHGKKNLNARTITLSASDFSEGPRFFFTNYHVNYSINNGSDTYPFSIDNVNSRTDFIPLTLSSSNQTVTTSNLGNWGIVYKIPVQFTNNSSTAVTFKGYIKTDSSSDSNNSYPVNYPIVYDGISTVKCGLISPIGNPNGYKNSWNWLAIPVAAGETISFTYYYVLGTNSCAGMRHVFDIEYVSEV